MRRRVLCAVIATAFVPVIAAAQVPLTEAEALARLNADSPHVRAVRAAIDIARADVLDRSRWPNPRLSVERESVAGVAETMLTVLQPLPITGRRSLERSASLARVDAASFRAGEAERQLRADVRR